MRSLRLKFPDDGDEARRTGYALLLLGVAALAGVLYQFNLAMNEAAYWDLKIASMERRVERKATSTRTPTPAISRTAQTPETKRENKKANAILNELDLPWEALLDAIEYASSHDV